MIQHRASATSPWQVQEEFATGPSQPRTLRAPVAATGDEVRLVGPCPLESLRTAGSATAQGGRPQDLYLQVGIDEGAGGCGPETLDLSVEALPDGLTATLDANSLTTNSAATPGQNQYTVLHVSVPATVAQTASASYDVWIDMTNRRSGRVTRAKQTVYLTAATTPVGRATPLLRLERPGLGWTFTDDSARTGAFQVPVAADVRPGSGIARVRFIFTPTSSNGCGTYEAVATGPSFATQVAARYLEPGSYTVYAIGEDQDGRQVARISVSGITSTLYANAPAGPLHLEAEDGRLSGGAAISTETSGYTGAGYVNGLRSNADEVTLPFTLTRPGAYTVSVRYRTPWGAKYGNLTVNDGAPIPISLPASATFATTDARTLCLRPGANTVGFGGNWSWYAIDSFDLTPVSIPSNGNIHLEAETGVLSGGAGVQVAAVGYEGSGYVAGLKSAADYVTLPFVAFPRTYDVFVRYRAPGGQTSGSFALDSDAPIDVRLDAADTFATASVGRMYVPTGANTVRVGGGTSAEIDSIELRPVIDDLILEAENGTLSGNATVSRATAGYTGAGYVDGLHSAADFTTQLFWVPTAGTYEAFVRYRTPWGLKYGSFTVDSLAPVDVRLEASDAFTNAGAGTVSLSVGIHTVKFGGNWSWYQIDRIEFKRVG